MIKSFLVTWEEFIELYYKIALLLTYIGFIPLMISIYYYLFRDFSPIRVMMNGFVLVVMIFANLKLQGGRVI